jgi:predicted transcriptional regulator
LETVTDIDHQEWQVRQIEEGLRDADAGDFASAEEVAAVFAKWARAGDPPSGVRHKQPGMRR